MKGINGFTAPKEKQYVAYITVCTSASIIPIQNKVKVIGTFREIMDAVAQLQRRVSLDINTPVNTFEMKSTVMSQLGEVNITLTLFI